MVQHMFGLELNILRRLESKKNRVYLVETGGELFVLKIYRAPYRQRSAVEYRVLQDAFNKGVPVPRPADFKEKEALLLEYIPGENVCNLLNRCCRPDYAQQLAEWYACFHGSFKQPGGKTLIKGDSILKNFIARPDGKLYGVDFEQAEPGDPARDIGQVCASILDTNPMFTPQKARLCRRLISCYIKLTGYSHGRYVEQIAAALRESSRWRPQQRTYLLQQASAMEQQGLEHFISRSAGY